MLGRGGAGEAYPHGASPLCCGIIPMDVLGDRRGAHAGWLEGGVEVGRLRDSVGMRLERALRGGRRDGGKSIAGVRCGRRGSGEPPISCISSSGGRYMACVLVAAGRPALNPAGRGNVRSGRC